MIDIICAICGKNQQIETIYSANFKESNISSSTYSARRIPDRVHYQILKCKNCGLVFSSPILPLSKITKLYRESFCSYDEQVPYTVNTYWNLFKKIKKRIPVDSKILDIGCGNGFFLQELTKNGIKNVYGVEPSEKMVKEAPIKFRKNIKVDIFRPNQFPRNYFNVACSFHTLDHVVDPNEFIKSVFEILKPGGFGLFVVHDTNSVFIRIFGEKWPIFDIEHIYLFNKKALSTLFLKNKLKIVETFNVRNVYPLSYYVKMSPFSKIIKKIGQNVIEKTGLSSLLLPLPGGNIGIIVQKDNVK